LGVKFKERVRVCQKVFLKAYDISGSNLDELQKLIKNEYVGHMQSDFTDRSTASRDTVASVQRKYGVELCLDRQSLGYALIPNTAAAKLCAGWFDYFFNLVGDKAPNCNEIHIEPCTKQSIYSEYHDTISCLYPENAKEYLLGYSQFAQVWNDCFPYCKIRQYKAVTGKCNCCGVLSDLRRKYKKTSVRQEVTDLHALHRITYMAERRTYYRKQFLSIMEPNKYMSVIFDGMAQGHTELPYMSGQKDFPMKMRMHLQGCIEHGQLFVSYTIDIASTAYYSYCCYLLLL